jgi:hypothetical protein
MDASIDSKSKPSHDQGNIWKDNIVYEIKDSHYAKPITNTRYDSQSNFVIQSRNRSNQKLQILKDEIIIKSSYSMMEKFEYCNLVKQISEDQKLTFDDIMHKNNCTLIHIFIYL